METYWYHPTAGDAAELAESIAQNTAASSKIAVDRIRVQLTKFSAVFGDRDAPYWRATEGILLFDGKVAAYGEGSPIIFEPLEVLLAREAACAWYQRWLTETYRPIDPTRVRGRDDGHLLSSTTLTEMMRRSFADLLKDVYERVPLEGEGHFTIRKKA